MIITMSDKGLSRRTAMQYLLSMAATLVVGFDPLARSWVAASHAADQKMQRLPQLDGTLEMDEATLEQFSMDRGRNVQRFPLAVLRPGSVGDVVKMVRYANEHQLKIGMRGKGHSQYGQTLVEAGIVIDSGTLRSVSLAAADSVDVQPGATWSEVNQVTLEVGRTPPVMPDTMMTVTVGGIVSVGGIGETSQHHGAIVDTVEELDVVTGEGELVTCSAQTQSDLFEMALAGFGQCGLIVRARLRLVKAPTRVVRQDLTYENLDAYLSDSARVLLERRFDYQRTAIVRKDDRSWSFRMSVGMSETPEQKPDLAALVSGLRFDAKAPPKQVSYWDYLLRNAARDASEADSLAKKPVPGAYVTMFVPASAAREFVARILATPEDTAGVFAFGFYPLNVSLFTRPLFRLPSEEVAYSLWMRRFASTSGTTSSEMISSNSSMLERMRAIGGKRYIPYGGFLSEPDWEEHFGPDVWQRLRRAKQRFDPNNALTPGPHVFA